jgi:hypothetical protein
VTAIVLEDWESGEAAANDKAAMAPSTRAPDVADNLPLELVGWQLQNHCGNCHDGGYR